MDILIKFKAPGFGKFNNHEYTNFMTRFCTLTTRTGAAVLHYGQADMDRLVMLTGMMQNLVDHTSVAEETEELQELEKKRDALGRYFLDSVRGGQDVPLEAKATAAKSLYKKLKPYEGFYSLPNMQETAAINGMLLDLSEEKNAAYVATLGLTEYVDELRAVNERYSALTDQRSASKEENRTADSATVRKEMDALYEYITTVIFAHNVITPSDEITKYINLVNVYIDDSNTAYNQRTGQTKAKTDSTPLPPATDSSGAGDSGSADGGGTTPDPEPEPEPTPDPTPDAGGGDDDDEGGLEG